MLVVGTQTNDQKKLIKIDYSGLLHHTLIVGQSGGGKSFFVARLVEEILLRTRARVLVIDPNGDFRQISKPSSTVWNNFEETFQKLAKQTVSDTLPSFDSHDDFLEGWQKRRFTYLAPGRERKPPQDRDVSNSLFVHWDTLDEEQRVFLLAANAQENPKLFMGLKAVTDNAKWVSQNQPTINVDYNLRGMQHVCEQFYQSDINLNRYNYAKLLKQEDWSAVRATLEDLRTRFTIWWSASTRTSSSRPPGLADFIDGAFRNSKISAKFWDALVLSLDASSPADTLLSADVALSRCWQNAKQSWREAADSTGTQDLRVPTFIVVDEAHNFAPEKTSDALRRRVTDRLLQIASEGRKYGLYLILATQRPTKLHRELVPECENACVLRLQSKVETEFASNVLGLSPTEAAQVPGFTLGQGVFIGRWVGGTNQLNTKIAPARINVGGGGLSDEWRTAPELTPNISESKESNADFILSLLSKSVYPIVFPSFAKILQDEFGRDECSDWFGKITLKKYLMSLQIEGLSFSNKPPGHVYLKSVHVAPSDDLDDKDDEMTAILHLTESFLDFSIGDKISNKAIFEALSAEIADNPFNLTDTSKNVRDRCVKNSVSVSRSLVNSILKGIHFSGHSYESDVDQSPEVLSEAFVRSVFFSLEKVGAIIDPSSQAKLKDVISGGLLIKNEKDPSDGS